MYNVITYKEYCDALGETYENTTPSWFNRIQSQAIQTIRKEIIDTKIFPINNAMFKCLKEYWKPMVLQCIARQIYYTYNNEYFLNNGVFANRSYNQTQYGEGPVDKAMYLDAINTLCTPASNALLETGWLCKRYGVHFDPKKYYQVYDPTTKDINWGQIGGDIANQLDLQELLTTKQDELSTLPSYGYNKLLMVDGSGTIDWVNNFKLSTTGTSSATAYFITDTDGNEWRLGGASGGGLWGEIEGDINQQTDLFDTFQYKVYYGETQPTTAKDNDIWVYQSEEKDISYNDLTHKPSINNVTLQNDLSLSALDLYSQEEVDEKIATQSATYRGSFVGGATPPASFDYDTFIKSQLPGVTPGNNDYCYVSWTDNNWYDKCVYVSESNLWTFQIRIQGQTNVRYVELYGIKGNVTQEQLDILKDSTSNYIWLGETTESDDGLILHCIYYNPENSATYEAVKGDTNYTLTLDLSTKQYNVDTTQFAKKDEIVAPHLYCYKIHMYYEKSTTTEEEKYYANMVIYSSKLYTLDNTFETAYNIIYDNQFNPETSLEGFPCTGYGYDAHDGGATFYYLSTSLHSRLSSGVKTIMFSHTRIINGKDMGSSALSFTADTTGLSFSMSKTQIF